MNGNSVSICWFRRDLRLADNPALCDAASRGIVIPVYIDDHLPDGPWHDGAAHRWWTHHSLNALAESLAGLGSRLVIRRGPALEVLKTLIKETGAKVVAWNRLYDPQSIGRDTDVKEKLRSLGVEAVSHKANLLLEPHEVANKQGKPFQVYTPFWRACYASLQPSVPLGAPKKLASPSVWPGGIQVADLALLPKIRWDRVMEQAWTPGEAGAAKRLAEFAESSVLDYAGRRDIPSVDGTSGLSPWLAHGEISPRQIWHAVLSAQRLRPGAALPAGVEVFFKEIAWREFAYHLLYHFPATTDSPLKAPYSRFPWRKDRAQLRAWQRGLTGYPFVDAGMRQLWSTGWMHNRVRMVVGSFLVKHLLLPWQEGARWFFDTLVDADLASNTLGWQWTAGCGADAAPYFRIFHPVGQGEKFDPDGAYIREWVPELAKMPAPHIHTPWEAPPGVLAMAGVSLGQSYPLPIVDHSLGRKRALEALASLKG